MKKFSLMNLHYYRFFRTCLESMVQLMLSDGGRPSPQR